MKKFYQFGFLFIFLVSLTSCFTYEEVEISKVKYVKLLEFSRDGLVVESEIKIKNPNWFQLSMVDSEFDIYIKGAKLTKARIDNKIKITKNSEDYHKVIMKSDSKDFTKGALVQMLGLTMGSGEIDFKVDGYVTGKAFLIKKKVRVTHEEKVPLKLF